MMPVMLKVHNVLKTLEKRLGRSRGPTGSGFWNFERCPFTTHSKRWVFGISPGQGRYRCFACARVGPLSDVGIEGEILAPCNKPPRITLTPPKALAPSNLPYARIPAPGERLTLLAEKALEYLAYRGVSQAVAVRHQLGYGTAGKWVGRVIHPWFHDNGALGGWQARLAQRHAPGGTKILTASQEDLPDGFFGARLGAMLGAETIQTGRPLVIVEGPYDAFSVERVLPAVALMGSAITGAQARRIYAKRPSEIIFAYDKDKSAEQMEQIREYYAMFSALGRVRFVDFSADWVGDWAEDHPGHPRDEASVRENLAEVKEFRPGM